MALLSAFSPTIRGRDAELVELGEQLDRVRSGSGAVVLIEGAPGMGKSRLIEEGVRTARRLNLSVGVGLAEPTESVAELAPLLRALFDGPDPMLDRDGLSSLNTIAKDRYWRLQELQSLLERASMGSPLVIFLDDLQWVDSGTLAAIRALPPRLASVPIGWVLAMRPDQGAGQLRSVLDYLASEGAQHIALTPLDRSAVAQVARDVMQAEPDDTVLQIADEAGGNPFLLAELLEGLRQENLVRIDAGTATLAAYRLPDRVRNSMRERLAGMSNQARQTATVAASLGRSFSAADLAELLDASPASLLAPLEELTEAGILRDGDEEISFQHDLIREAVRRSSAPSARRALDRQAAEIMLARGALPIEVAVQLADSAQPGDEVAITTLLAAAQALATTDPGASADLSRQALELAPERHPLSGPLVVQAAMSLHAAGRIEEAKAFADNAMREVLPATQEAEVRLGIAGMWLVSPDVRVHASQEALKLAHLPVNLRAAHLGKLAYNLVAGGRVAETAAVLSDASIARASSDRAVRFPLALSEGGLEYLRGDFGTALERFETILRDGLADAHGLDELLTRLWRASTLFALDRAEDALRVADGIVAESLERGFAWFLHVAEITRGHLLLQMGQLDDALPLLSGWFDPHGSPVVTVMDATGVVALGRLALHTGDGRSTRQTAEIAKTMLTETTPGVRRHAAWLLALQATADSDPKQAYKWLCAAGDPEREQVLSRVWNDVGDDTQLTRIAVQAGDQDLAQRAVADATRRAELSPTVASLAAVAAHAAGIAHDDTEKLAEAVHHYEQSPRLLALATAWEDLGLALQQQGTGEAGSEELTEALVIFARAGATRDAARLRSHLRGLGIRRRVTTAEKPVTGWAAMTKSELAVAELAADGLTNREIAERLFVSPHTINTHMRQVFAKLEIKSRITLTRLAAERHVEPYAHRELGEAGRSI